MGYGPAAGHVNRGLLEVLMKAGVAVTVAIATGAGMEHIGSYRLNPVLERKDVFLKYRGPLSIMLS